MLNQDLLKIIACPACKGGIYLTEEGNGLVCRACRLRFPVREGIPVLLTDQAEQLESGNSEVA